MPSPWGGRLRHEFRMVQRQRAGNVDRQFPDMLLELPSIQLATRHAQPDAGMMFQIVGSLWRDTTCHISRGRDGHEADLASERYGDHILRHGLREPDARIETARDDVDQ